MQFTRISRNIGYLENTRSFVRSARVGVGKLLVGV